MSVTAEPETTFVGRMIDPYDYRTWPDEAQRNHRLRRALHELMVDPAYEIEVGKRPDGEIGIRLKPAESVTPEARMFLAKFRDELITHHYWLEQVDEYHGTTPVPVHGRG